MLDFFSCFSCKQQKNDVNAQLEIQNIEIQNLESKKSVKISLECLISLNCTSFQENDFLYIMKSSQNELKSNIISNSELDSSKKY